MSQFVQHLLRKPQSVRRRYSLAIAGIITVLIFTVWISTLETQISENNIARDTTEEQSPFAAIRGNFGAAFEGLRQKISEFQAGFEALKSR